MGGCGSFHGIRERQTVPATMRYHYIPIRLAKLKIIVLLGEQEGTCSQSSLLELRSAFLESQVAADIPPGTDSPESLSHGNKNKYTGYLLPYC